MNILSLQTFSDPKTLAATGKSTDESGTQQIVSNQEENKETAAQLLELAGQLRDEKEAIEVWLSKLEDEITKEECK